MNANEIINRLTDLFDAESRARVYRTLRAEPLVWKALQPEEVFQHTVEVLGSESANWSPASIALLCLEGELTPETLSTVPMPPLPQELRQQAAQIYQSAFKSNDGPASLDTAALFALALRERRRLTENWTGLIQEISRLMPDGPLGILRWRSSFTILLKLIPDPMELFRELGKLSMHHMDHSGEELILYILESNPLTANERADYLLKLLQPESSDVQQEWIAYLAKQDDSDLSGEVSRRLFALSNPQLIQDGAENGTETPPRDSLLEMDPFARIPEIQNRIDLAIHSNNSAQAKTLIDKKNELIKIAGARSLAEKAYLAEAAGDFTQAVSIWKEVMKQIPNSDLARANFILAGDSAGILLPAELDWGPSTHPIVLAARAYHAYQNANYIAASECIENLIGVSREDSPLDLPQSVRIAGLLSTMKMYRELEKFLDPLVIRYPNSTALNLLHAKAAVANGSTTKALDSAWAASISAEDPTNAKRMLASIYEKRGEFQEACGVYEDLVQSQKEPNLEIGLEYIPCALKANQSERALHLCQSLQMIHPHNGELQCYLGEIFSSRGDSENAIKHYEKATMLSPEVPRPWLVLAEHFQASDNLDRSLQTLNTAVRAAPSSPEIHLALAEAMTKRGMPSEALAYFRSAHQIAPFDPKYALALARAYNDLGHTIDAESILEEAFKRSPNQWEVGYNLALTSISNGNHTGAIHTLILVMRLQPPVKEPYLDFAQILLDTHESTFEANELTSVEHALNQAREMDPVDPRLKILTARLRVKQGDSQSAHALYIDLAENSFQLDDELRWQVNYGLGLTASDLGQMEIALAALQEAVIQNPTNLVVQQKLAEAYAHANLQAAALQAAHAALALDPSNLDNILWYGDFCIKMKDFAEALSSLDSVIKQKPDSIDFRIKLGELQLSLEEIAEAKQTFKLVLTLPGVSIGHLLSIANLLKQAGEFDEASAYLEFGVKTYPEDAFRFLQELIQIDRQLGDVDTALLRLDNALQISPLDPELLRLKTDLHAQALDFQSALAALETLTNSIPENQDYSEETGSAVPRFSPEIYIRMISLLRADGRFEDALASAIDLTTAYPDSAEGWALRADLEFCVLQNDSASTSADRVTSLAQVKPELAGFAQQIRALLSIAASGSLPVTAVDQLAAAGDSWPVQQLAIGLMADPLIYLHEEEEVDQLKSETAGLTIAELLDFGPRFPASGALPPLPVYDLYRSSPVSIYVLIQAAVNSCLWAEAEHWSEEVKREFPLNARSYLLSAAVRVRKAENARIFAAVRSKRFASSEGSLNKQVYEQISEDLLSARQLAASDEVDYWKERALAVYHPTAENTTALQSHTHFKDPMVEFYIFAANPSISGLIQKSAVETSPDSGYAFLTALQLVEKAPREALAILSELDTETPVHDAVRAMAEFRIENPSSALEHIERALEKWSDEPEWQAFAAECCSAVGNTAGSLYHAKVASDLEPDNIRYSLLIGETSLASGDAQQAIQYLRKAVQLAPAAAAAWRLLAKAQQQIGEMTQASAMIEKAIALEPVNIETHILAGEFALDANHPVVALEKAETALKIDPKNGMALVIKMRAFRQMDQVEDALRLADRYSLKISNPLPLLLEKARIIRETSNKTDYLKMLQKLAEDYPKESDVLVLYAESLADSGQSIDALRIAQMVLKQRPDMISMHNLCGRVLRAAGQLDAAVDHFTQAVAQKPNAVESYLELAKTYLDRRDNAKAMTVYQSAIDVNPNDYRPYYQAGLALRDSKDYRNAEKMLRKASELAKDNVSILRQLGAVIALNLVHHSQEASVHS